MIAENFLPNNGDRRIFFADGFSVEHLRGRADRGGRVRTAVGVVTLGQFGQYQLRDLLGRGGMGEVYRAFDTRTNRVVALKVLPVHLANDQHFQQRFRREALAAAGLNEPHVVPIHNFGEIDGRLYVDMRLIDGADLASIIGQGPLAPQRAVAIVDQVANALDAAHRIGLVHRDVKPSNILVGRRDFAYLIDFGIARGVDEAGLTGTGQTMGTLAYMAPERLNSGGPADARSDVYALACVLFECLTGRQPFAGPSIEQQIVGHITTPPPAPSAINPEVPAAFDAVIAVGMAKQPEHRHQTAEALADAARAALFAPPDRSRPEMTVADPSRTSLAATGFAPTQGRPAAEPTAMPTQYRQVAPAPPGPSGDHGGPITPGPWWKRHPVTLTAVVAGLVTTGAISALVLTGSTAPATVGVEAERAATPLPDLRSLPLSATEINTIMGHADLVYVRKTDQPVADSRSVEPSECHASYFTNSPVEYPGSDVEDLWDIMVQGSGEPTPGVRQVVFQMRSDEAAKQVLDVSGNAWHSCVNKEMTAVPLPDVQLVTKTGTITSLVVRDDMLTQASSWSDGTAETNCQRVRTIAARYVIDVETCAESISDEAAIVAGKIADKVSSR